MSDRIGVAIKGALLLGVVFFVFGFAQIRHDQRSYKTEVILVDSVSTLSKDIVDKLLIQKLDHSKNDNKLKVDLRLLEEVLLTHTLISNAQVYKTIDGKLVTEVKQRFPVALVQSDEEFYLDESGVRIEKNDFKSIAVKADLNNLPVIVGKFGADNYVELMDLLKSIQDDGFFASKIKLLKKREDGFYELELRNSNLIIELGNNSNINQKLNNFKAFFAKAKRDAILDDFSRINLAFDNQVVCTKRI
ncbi:MAG: cell division protein FtsQ/DivIB [Flavobacteriaceae bacterium]